MQELIFQNLQSKAINLVLEPWATCDPIEPNSKVVIGFEPTEFDMEFVLEEDGSAFIFLVSTRVIVRIGDEVREYTPDPRTLRPR